MSDWLAWMDEQEYGHANEKDESGDEEEEDGGGMDDDSFLD